MKKKNFLAAALLVAGLSSSAVMISPAYAVGSNVFSVTRVAPWDQLNVRKYPGVASTVVGQIPSDGKGVMVSNSRADVGNTTWVKVSWGPVKGWVNERFLAPMIDEAEVKKDEPVYRSRTERNNDLGYRSRMEDTRKTEEAAAPVMLECGGIKPFWNIDLTDNDLQVSIKGDRYTLPISYRRKSSSDRSLIIEGRDREGEARLYLSKDNVCRDGITDISYPYTVKAIIDGRRSFSGCCSVVGQ